MPQAVTEGYADVAPALAPVARTRLVAYATILVAVLLAGALFISRSCGTLLAPGHSNGAAVFAQQQQQPSAAATAPSFTAEEVRADEAQLRRAIRQPGRTGVWDYLAPAPRSCDARPGNWQCISRNRTAGCCCCCWQPVRASCVASFQNMSDDLLRLQVASTRFYDTWQPRPTNPPPAGLAASPRSPLKQAAIRACPWFDRGRWARPLPLNFVAMSEDMATKTALATCGCHNARPGIGPLFLWQLASTMRRLRPAPPDAGENAPGGIYVMSGDSMTRQLFSRMIHMIRSRECSADAEMRRSGVFELQIHESAAYVATVNGDAFVSARNCKDGLEFLAQTMRNADGLKEPIVLQACFVWDNTPSALTGTVHNLHQLEHRVAALVFFPMIWFCGTRTALCMHANQSNGAALSVIGTAVHYGAPSIVVATNVIRQHFAYFNVPRVAARNEQLARLFPSATPVPWVRSMGAHGTWSTVRLYDFARRHDVLAPEQCDVVHGMCMFLPAREFQIFTQVRALFGGLACPGNGTCQDMGNFILVREIFSAVRM